MPIRAILPGPGDSLTQALVVAGEEMRRFVDEYVRKASIYPSQAGSRPAQFRSRRQRQYFFQALEEGRIRVPYQRTQQLKGSWKVTGPTHTGASTKVEGFSEGKVAPYNKFIIGKEQSAEMRARGWPNAVELAEQMAPEAAPRVQAAMNKAALSISVATRVTVLGR